MNTSFILRVGVINDMHSQLGAITDADFHGATDLYNKTELQIVSWLVMPA